MGLDGARGPTRSEEGNPDGETWFYHAENRAQIVHVAPLQKEEQKRVQMASFEQARNVRLATPVCRGKW